MRINNRINFNKPTDLIEPNYPGQHPRQMPIYLKISFDTDPIEIYATTQDYRITGTPFDEWNGHVQVFELPSSVNAAKLKEWVDDKLIDYVKILAGGYESCWNGNNYVAKWSDKARQVLEDLNWKFSQNMDINSDFAPVTEMGGLWEPGEWLMHSIFLPDLEDPTVRIDKYMITATTPDNDLKKISDALEEEGEDMGVVWDGDMYEYLEDLRQDCIDLVDVDE